MKRIFLIVVILVIGFSIFAINSTVAIGYQQKITMNHLHSPYYVSIDLWQDLGEFTLYGNYKTEMQFGYIHWYLCPNQDYATIGLSYDFQIFEMSIEHCSQHPVLNSNNDMGIGGGYTTIELKIGNYKK